MSKETKGIHLEIQIGDEKFDLMHFAAAYAELTELAVANYVQREVTNKGGVLDQMQNGIEYRKVLIDRVHKHWEESRIGNDAFHKLMSNPETRELGLDLYGAYHDYRRNSVEDEVLPWHESMRLVHLLMANVYGVSLDEQQDLTAEVGEDWVKMMGTTEDMITDASHRSKAKQEVQVIESYVRQFRDFNTRYFTRVFGKPYGFEDASMKEKVVTTSDPGSAKRQVFFVLLHELYGLDPRNREEVLKPSDDLEIKEKQAEWLAMEAQLVDEIVAHEVANRFRSVKLSDYVD
ncbi:MAG TPA: hypothetical protein PKJ26_01555 [Candidatus Woesebacteria bacterium]|nr:hypothetical protein [Candidatus Woesebacteria bacterium]HNS65162.1 hypothetical protein [Candidatus Woesebacteria bacterium]